MSAKELTSDEAVETMSALAEKSGSHRHMNGTGIGVCRENLRTNGHETDRWQKHGHDRIYFKDRLEKGHDGYIDLKTGEVVGSTPVVDVEVESSGDGVWVLYHALIEDLDSEEPELIAAIER